MVSLVACGGSSDSASVDTVPATGVSVTVDVLDNSYRPLVLEIAAGTEVVFDNQGRNDHNLLPDSVSGDAQLREMLATDSSAAAWGWSPPILSQRRFIPMSFRPRRVYLLLLNPWSARGGNVWNDYSFLSRQ